MIRSFNVTGNQATRIHPGETINLFISSEATGPGTFVLRIEPDDLPFVSNWDSKRTECPTTCVLSDTLTLAPTAADVGRYSFKLIAQILDPDGNAKWEKDRTLTVVPRLEPEPPFTAGTSNEICWEPFDAVTQELIFFPIQGVKTFPDLLQGNMIQECKTIEGLTEKQTYGYYLNTTLRSNGQFIPLNSDTLFSMQDGTAPPAVELTGFTLDDNGTVSLRWPFVQDEVSRIEKYQIYRKQANGNGDFVLVDTLNYFPVSQLSRANYQVEPARFAAPLYVDASEAIIGLPQELFGLTMIRTAITDRWREEEDFLSFTLLAESHIYLAYDKNMTALPEWVWDDFQPTELDLQTSRNQRGFRILKSRKVFPAGEIVLGGNFARSAEAIPAADPRTYIVFVEPVSEIFPFEMGEEITFTEPLGRENDLNTFQYRIDAVDAAGNVSQGMISSPIILDLTGRCRPAVASWFEFQNQSEQYAQGTNNTICIQDPNLDAVCAGFRGTDSLRFQAVRNNVDLFETRLPSEEGDFFFDSGWRSATELERGTCFEFNLLPDDRGVNFVNGEAYFYRVQSKDRFNNTSSWSDTVAAIQDAFPPGDISGLAAQTRAFENINDGCIELSWQPASDPVSGLASYTIYRKDDTQGTDFQAIATVPATAQPTYCDTLSSIGHNGLVRYRIGSVDNVDNVRTFSDTQAEIAVQALNGPFLSIDTTQVVFCHTGLAGTRANSLTLFWNFEQANVATFELEVQKPTGADSELITINGGSTAQFDVPLDVGDGLYRFRVRAVYADGRRTIFSNTITVKRKTSLQNVEEFQAHQNPGGSGDVVLSWSHPDSVEISEYRVFAWPEGETMPDAPIALLPADSTEWLHQFGERLIAYQCTNYAVQAVDCFGLVSEADPVMQQYSNRRPVFDDSQTAIVEDDITVCWQRPAPRALTNDTFEATVLIYRDSLNTVPDTLTVFDRTCVTLFDADPGQNYIFVVRETPLSTSGQSCAEVLQSARSRPLTVPFENVPMAVDFIAQPLPVLPDSISGEVFLKWDVPDDKAVNRFLIRWRSDSISDEVEVADSDTFLVSDLDVTESYRFEVLGIDSLGQLSENNRIDTLDFGPRWKFTPKPQQLQPNCFRDAVTVTWTWLDEALEPSAENFGTDSVFIELSIDPDFEFRKTLAATSVSSSNSITLSREDYPFVTNQNTGVFVRIRAKDKWNHFSPWSTCYSELGSLDGEYDEIPPPSVTAVVDSIKAPAFGAEQNVNVYLRWNEVSDNCSGTWFYEIFRNDNLVGRDTSSVSVHRFIDRGVQAGANLLTTEWRIHAVDSVGNRQALAPTTGTSFFLTAPDSAWCPDDTTLCWLPGSANTPGINLSYFIEGARFAELLGVPDANIVDGPLEASCTNFSVPWEGVHWRIKARVDNVESAWSDTFFCDLSEGLLVSSVDAGHQSEIPQDFELQPNYPNPFNPSTTIRYSIPATENGSVPVMIDVFNTSGQRIRSLVKAEQQPGRYTVVWNGRDDRGNLVGSGVYFYRIRAGEFIKTRKLTFLK